MKIARLHARQILDSRGNPTVETDLYLEDGTMVRASVPSGASTGANEALELRDDDKAKYLGKGVLKAVENVNTLIAQVLIGMDVFDQETVDQKMLDLDGTTDKSKLGANAILAVSLSCAKAAANSQKKPLYQYFHEISCSNDPITMPLPMINIINGGVHANFATDIQEFMIVPIGAKTFSQSVQLGSEIFHHLGEVLKNEGYPTTVGDEGGYALTRTKKDWNGNSEALELIKQAVANAGYIFGEDIVLALDVAASELFENGHYRLRTNNWELDTEGMIDALVKYVDWYPIVSIEDGLDQSDWEGWVKLTKRLGSKILLVGDDLFVTNTKFLKRGIKKKAANTILIKPNQIGTLTETIQAVKTAKDAGWHSIISHRSGETEDTTIAHLAVGLSTGLIKTGSVSRTDRTAKYNELLRIAETLGPETPFAGKNILNYKP